MRTVYKPFVSRWLLACVNLSKKIESGITCSPLSWQDFRSRWLRRVSVGNPQMTRNAVQWSTFATSSPGPAARQSPAAVAKKFRSRWLQGPRKQMILFDRLVRFRPICVWILCYLQNRAASIAPAKWPLLLLSAYMRYWVFGSTNAGPLHSLHASR
jgi:hypothetical protein